MRSIWNHIWHDGHYRVIACENRYSRLSWHLVLLSIFAIIMVTASLSKAEVRTYSQMDTHVLNISHTASVNIFLKQENRFRESGLVLNKVFIGLKPKLRSWLTTQVYYANKELNYTLHLNKHMLVGDIILSTRIGLFAVKNRSGNEWHITDRFYRYRNYSELVLKTPVRWLSLWSSEEWRYDSDQKRVNMNDVRLGAGCVVRKNLKLKIFYDLESKRRNNDSWHQKPFLGLMLDVHV